MQMIRITDSRIHIVIDRKNNLSLYIDQVFFN